MEAPRGIATPSFPKVLLPNLCPSHATSMASLAELTAPLLSLSLPAVGAAAWARKALQPAAPPRPPHQLASSPSASRRPLEAPATFQRPSPTPCSWPGPWQSPYGLGPPCAGCPLPTAGPGSRPGGGTDSAPHTRRGEGTWGPNLPPCVLGEDPAVTTLSAAGAWRGESLVRIQGWGAPFPLPVCVSINKTHGVSVNETVAAQSHTPSRVLPSLPQRPQSCLVVSWMPTPEPDPERRTPALLGKGGGGQKRGRSWGGRGRKGRSPGGGANEQVTQCSARWGP